MTEYTDHRKLETPSHIKTHYMRQSLKRQCLYLVTEDRHRAACDATYWLKTYCRHWGTVGHDTQTLDNLNKAERITARQHLGTLRRLGMIREGGFRGNFEILTITPSQR